MYLSTSGELHRRERRIAQARVLKLTHQIVERRLQRPVDARSDATVRDLELVARRELSPARCARGILTRLSEEKSAHV